jgi:hypothetical protein
MLWAQLREKDENGETTDDPGDVVFLQRDPTGQVSPCAPNKIILTQAQWIRPNGELVPRPFSTRSNRPNAQPVRRVVDRFRLLGRAGRPFEM